MESIIMVNPSMIGSFEAMPEMSLEVPPEISTPPVATPVENTQVSTNVSMSEGTVTSSPSSTNEADDADSATNEDENNLAQDETTDGNESHVESTISPEVRATLDKLKAAGQLFGVEYSDEELMEFTRPENIEQASRFIENALKFQNEQQTMPFSYTPEQLEEIKKRNDKVNIIFFILGVLSLASQMNSKLIANPSQ